jgi:catechol 2,3-dioxygenase
MASYPTMNSPVLTRRAGTARLPPDTHIGRVRLRVADLERSLGFYRDVLGLQVEEDSGGSLSLAPRIDAPGDRARSRRELIALEERPGISRRPPRPRTAGLYHVALLLPSRKDLGRSLLALGRSGYPLRGMSDHAVSESLYLDDPDGNGLEIYADRSRDLWPIQDGIVQLTVEPMDVDGVIAAGQESPEPWNGISPDTTVGHLHFTVSDMERAVSFYRDVVGFDLMMRIPSLTAVSAGGYHHHLNLNTWAGEGAPADSDQIAGLIAWELRVPEEQERRHLIDRLAGASALLGSARKAAARDPDGALIEIGTGNVSASV